MVVRMRHTRSHTKNRRSHHALVSASLRLCKECGSPKLPHVLCSVCGKYKGNELINTKKKLEKIAKKAKEKEATK